MPNVNPLAFKNVKCEALWKFMMISLDAQGIWILIDNPPPTAPMILIRLQNKEQFLYFFLSPSSSSISSLIFLLHFEFDFYVSASLRLSIPKTIGRFVQAPGCHFQCPMRFSLRCTSNNHFQALDKEPECPRDAVRPLGACPPELAVSFSLQCIFFRTVW